MTIVNAEVAARRAEAIKAYGARICEDIATGRPAHFISQRLQLMVTFLARPADIPLMRSPAVTTPAEIPWWMRDVAVALALQVFDFGRPVYEDNFHDDGASLWLYDVKSKVAIGGHPPGTAFESVLIRGTELMLMSIDGDEEFLDDDEGDKAWARAQERRYRLDLSVGSKIESTEADGYDAYTGPA